MTDNNIIESINESEEQQKIFINKDKIYRYPEDINKIHLSKKEKDDNDNYSKDYVSKEQADKENQYFEKIF